MATIPNLESILLQVHQSLGLQTTVKKEKLIRLQKTLPMHIATCAELLYEIFAALGLNQDHERERDAMQNLFEWASANSQIEQSCWTFGASAQQILWFMAAYVYAPGFGRRLAFWNLPGVLDPDMPGGSFWYLPQLDENSDKRQLKMPVAQVVDWLFDLLGCPMDQVKDALGGGQSASYNTKVAKVQADSIERVLYNWRNGELPRVENIEKYFAEGSLLEFNGAIQTESAGINFQEILAFIQSKGLNADSLRKQIPMTEIGKIEAILNGVASNEEREHFCELLALRYAVPSLQTIRRRLLIARAFQDAYQRLCNFLLGDKADIFSADPTRNKALQIISIFQTSYNLTIEAFKKSCGEQEENFYFESKITPWDAHGIFLSVLPSKNFTRWLEMGPLLTRRFSELHENSELEDHIGHDLESAKSIIARNILRIEIENEQALAVLRNIRRCQGASPYRTLQQIDNFSVLIDVAKCHDLPLRKRRMVLTRAQQIASTDNEKIQVILLQIGEILDHHEQKTRPANAEQIVEMLLDEAKRNQAFSIWQAVVLQFEAKHFLACNEFEHARKLFDAALEAATDTSYGRFRADVARDAFALAVAHQENGYHLQNLEKYMRNMLMFGGIDVNPFTEHPALEDIACEVDAYFWDSLYFPYSGYEYQEQPSTKELQKVLRDAFPLILRADWPQWQASLQKNKNLANRRLKEVRSNSVLMLGIKFLYTGENIQPKLQAMLPPELHNQNAQFIEMQKNSRVAIGMLIEAWPKSVSLTDFKLQTPLMMAANHGDLVILQKILQAKPDITLQDFKGRTALHAAVAARSLDCVKALLAVDPEIVKVLAHEKQTVLHTAVKVGHSAITQAIFDCAPELVHVENVEACTPLALAMHLRDNPDAYSAFKMQLAQENRAMGAIEEFQEICRILSGEQ